MSSKEFAAGLGYMGQEEVCHRANICLLLAHHDDSGGDTSGRCAGMWARRLRGGVQQGGWQAGSAALGCGFSPTAAQAWPPTLRHRASPHLPALRPDHDHEHASEPHSPYDGPSRSPTPPVVAGQHSAAIAAAVAEVEAARAAGQDAGIRFQLPPRPPHHTSSSGSMGGGGGSNHDAGHAPQQAQHAAAADDIAARLAVLQSR